MRAWRGAHLFLARSVLLIDENRRTPCSAEYQPPLAGHPWTALTGVRGDSPHVTTTHKPASSARTAPPTGAPPPTNQKQRGHGAQAPHTSTTKPTKTQHPLGQTHLTPPSPAHSPNITTQPQKPPSQPFSHPNNTHIRKTPQDTPKEPPQAPAPSTRHESQQPKPTVTHRQTRHKRGTVTPAQKPKRKTQQSSLPQPHPQPQTTLNPHCTNPPQAPHRNPRTATTTPPLLVPNSRNHQKETLIAKTNSNPHNPPLNESTPSNHPYQHQPRPSLTPGTQYQPTSLHHPPHSPTVQGPARQHNLRIPTSKIIPVRKPQLEQPTDTTCTLPLTHLYQNTTQNPSSSLHYQHTATTHHKTPSVATPRHRQNTTKKTLLEHPLEKPKETPTPPPVPYRRTTPKETHKAPPYTQAEGESSKANSPTRVTRRSLQANLHSKKRRRQDADT